MVKECVLSGACAKFQITLLPAERKFSRVESDPIQLLLNGWSSVESIQGVEYG